MFLLCVARSSRDAQIQSRRLIAGETDVEPIMATTLKKIWQGWKKIAHKIGVAQTYVIVTLFYWLIVPFFSLIRLQNPLRLRPATEGSFWLERKSAPNALDQAKQQS